MSHNSIKIAAIKKETIGDKVWVKVYFDNGTEWIPALWEQGYLAMLVAQCEEKKYPNLPYDAKDMPRQFLSLAINLMTNDEFIILAEKFKLKFNTDGSVRESFLRLLDIVGE
jgi:hypothetical protein